MYGWLNVFYCEARKIKKVKIIISAIIIFIGLILIGENFQDYLGSFDTELYHIHISLPEGVSQDEMLKDITETSQKNKVDIFAITHNLKNKTMSEMNFYGSKNTKSYINDCFDISDKIYNSILFGETKVNFYRLKNLPDVTKVNDFYLSGSFENMQKFHSDIYEKYSPGLVKKGVELNEYTRNTVLIWCLLDGIIIFLSFYDVILQKKENFLKITLGESIHKIILKNVVTDTLLLSIIYTTSLFLLSKYTNPFFNINISNIMFLILIIINALLYLNLYFYDYKEEISNSKSSKKLLSINYSLKLITIVITIVILSSNFACIYTANEFYKQKGYMKEHSDYYFTDFGYKFNDDFNAEEVDESDRNTKIVNEIFYRTNYNKYNATMICEWMWGSKDKPYLIANTNAVLYLKKNIKEIENRELKNKIYILIPENLSEVYGKGLSYKETFRDVKDYYIHQQHVTDDCDFEMIIYNSAKIIYFDEMLSQMSSWARNPVIVLNNINMDKSNFPINSEVDNLEYCQSIIYKLSKEEVDNFICEFNLTNDFNGITNVYDNYLYNWNLLKSGLYLNIILSVLVIFLECIIITSILKLEYELNAVELSLKKVMGYTLWQRNKKIIVMTMSVTLASVSIGLLISYLLKIGELRFIAAGGLVVLVFEMLIILFFVRKLEKTNIQNILKGEKL